MLNFSKIFLFKSLGGTGKKESSIIYKSLQGKLHAFTKYVAMEQLDNELSEITLEAPHNDIQPFVFLTLDVPELKLFADKKTHDHVIPRIDIYEMLQKYNGENETHTKRYGKDIVVQRFLIHEPPEYLIIVVDRFHKSLWDTQKNPTIITFPLTDLDMSQFMEDKSKTVKYDIIANVIHDDNRRDELDDSSWRDRQARGTVKNSMYTAGKPTTGSYRVDILHQQSGCWFEVQDLHVKPILKEQVQLSESYIQIWKLQK